MTYFSSRVPGLSIKRIIAHVFYHQFGNHVTFYTQSHVLLVGSVYTRQPQFWGGGGAGSNFYLSHPYGLAVLMHCSLYDFKAKTHP